jgi:hypothetical protein
MYYKLYLSSLPIEAHQAALVVEALRNLAPAQMPDEDPAEQGEPRELTHISGRPFLLGVFAVGAPGGRAEKSTQPSGKMRLPSIMPSSR